MKTVPLGRVLVTGGAGMLGSQLVQKLLENGYRVRSFDQQHQSIEHQRLELLEGSLNEQSDLQQACEGVDTVFHAAGVISMSGHAELVSEEDRRCWRVNVEGTDRLLSACQRAGVSRFVYTSSNSVVFDGRAIVDGDETLPYASRPGLDIYSRSKMMAERAVLAANGVEGMLCCALRPSGIWGEGDKVVYNRLMVMAASGWLRCRIGSPRARLDNSFVLNLVQAELLAATHLCAAGGAAGQAYFINDGEPVNMMQFAEPLLAAVNHRLPTLLLPEMVLKVMVGFWRGMYEYFGGAEPVLTTIALQRITVDNFYSIAKAKRELGYQPEYSTERAQAISIDYYSAVYHEAKQARGRA
ncbi:3beta-hydroxy-delta5-steroid dehydrogenase/steroid delta-isomerase [Sinobacterium caligoides]|uniref:3beta-hydroxy-delta5-steroid dehydrogenase/steroid delta-isomerase n=1 Tax=Sinobacterium caligoides TaxID=933926 RepID=A0A3N2DPD1_9GAMM|nr:3beta-hydroxy-delta5-steroid dehydrogenase/steroid delta-isomerase [Sinobacterium caligoides]